jgi:predicted nucleic acid-binding protein
LKLLLDTNIVLDVLAKREPFWHASARVMAYVNGRKVQGLIAAHTLTTIYYLLSKHLNRKKARSAIIQLLEVLHVATVDHKVILEALSLNWNDFEDSVQAAAALQSNATHIITRNPRDFSSLVIPVLTPEEFLRSEAIEG